MNDKTPMSLTDMKNAIKANLGTPRSNANAAKTLAGTQFYAENAKKEFVLATLLADLSPKGKLTASLACAVDGCNTIHVREMSDWHQSLKCPVHAEASKAKLTDAEKAERQLARAQATVAKLTAQAVPPTLRSGPTLDAIEAAEQENAA